MNSLLPYGRVERVVEFNSKHARNSKDPKIREILFHLAFHKKLRVGKIYRRRDNGEYWYISNIFPMARYLSKERYYFLLEWDTSKLLPDPILMGILGEIGGMPNLDPHVDGRTLEFPVCAKIDERVNPFCILKFSESAPTSPHMKDVVTLDQAKRIRVSPFAIPYSFRISSASKPEIRPGFAPSMFQMKSGRVVACNGRADFVPTDFENDEIVRELPYSSAKNPEMFSISASEITYIIGKWNWDLERLYNKHIKDLKASLKRKLM